MNTCQCGHDWTQHFRAAPTACKKRCHCVSFKSVLPGRCDHGQWRPHEFTLLGRLPKLQCPGPPDPLAGIIKASAGMYEHEDEDPNGEPGQ